MEPRLVPLGHESEPDAGFALPAVLGRGAATGVHDVRCSRRQCTVAVVDAAARTAGVVVAGVNASLLVCGRTGARQPVARTHGRVPMAPGDVLELLPGITPAFRLVWPVPTPPAPSAPASAPSSLLDDSVPDVPDVPDVPEENEENKGKEEEEEEVALVAPFHAPSPAAAAPPAGSTCELWMPLLGTGMLGMDAETAAAIALAAVREAGAPAGGARVVLAVEDAAAHRAVCAMLAPHPVAHLVLEHASVADHVCACLRDDAGSSSGSGKAGTHVYHALECSWRWTLVNAPAVARAPWGAGSTVGAAVRAAAARGGPGRLAEVRAVALPPALALLLCVAPNGGNAAKTDHIADAAVARAALAQTCRSLLAVFHRIAAATAAAGATVVLSPVPPSSPSSSLQ